MHPTDSDLERLVHAELPEPDRRRLRLHLQECPPCAARLRSCELAERRIAEWLTALDHPVPRLEPRALAERARRRAAPRGLLAAGVASLLVAVAAAAAVVPGSPVQRLLQRAIIEWRGGAPGTPPSAPAPAPSAARSGVSFVPEEELEIAFLHPQPEGALRIFGTDGPEVRIRETGGASAYRVEGTQLIVDNRGSSASYEIQLPRGLPRARIRIQDRVVFEKRGDVTAPPGALDPPAEHHVPFGGAGPADP